MKHEWYVWSAYLVTAVLMAIEPWLVSRRRRRARKLSE
jgi:heme exporter protein CcmD